MDLIPQLLSGGLRKRNPQLDLWGSDRRVLCIACQDFMNYLRVHWGLRGEGGSRSEARERLYGYFYEKPRELEEFVHLWSGVWMRKWKKRVKLILGSQDSQRWKRIDELLSKAEPRWKRLKHRNEVKNLVIDALIRNGEICGTAILAENMLKIELARCGEKTAHEDEREHLLAAVNNVLRRVKQISKSDGPLIFVRIDKRFFQLLQEGLG